MTGNTIGERFVLTSFGESHGKCIGAVIDGCPAGLRLAEEDIQRDLDLRRPGQSIVTTQRKEADVVEIMSGTFRGYSTGAPIMTIIHNQDQDSRAYDAIVNTPRPGHADATAKAKYGGFNDYRGGGRFSGRITATFVMGGAIARKLLRETLGVEIIAYTRELGGIRAENFTLDDARNNRYSNDVRCPDPAVAEEMRKKVIEMRGKGDSLGGIVECVALNVPMGLGEPVFDTLESDLAKIALSIPAAKGVEFGSGFASTRMTGTQNNDLYQMVGGKMTSQTNNAGGILGGISNGMPIVYGVAFKPAASIAAEQRTLDTQTGEEVDLVVPGRHDPTVVPRAVPVVESVTALVLVDHAIRAGFIAPVLRSVE